MPDLNDSISEALSKLDERGRKRRERDDLPPEGMPLGLQVHYAKIGRDLDTWTPPADIRADQELLIRGWKEWDEAHKGFGRNEETRQKLGFHTMDEATRKRYTPISPFSITQSTRGGQKHFNVMDMRTSKTVNVPTKREATHVAKMIEAHTYATGPEPSTGKYIGGKRDEADPTA